MNKIILIGLIATVLAGCADSPDAILQNGVVPQGRHMDDPDTIGFVVILGNKQNGVRRFCDGNTAVYIYKSYKRGGLSTESNSEHCPAIAKAKGQ